MLFIQYFAKLIKILRSAASPSQIAGGFILGMLIGLSPSLISLTNLILVLLLIILNVNLATALFSFAVFSGIAYLIDPLSHSLGYFLLVGLDDLREFWISLYNAPLTPYTFFNNTVVLGSLIIALVLLIPMYFLVKTGIIKYREKYEPRVQNWKWMKMMKSTLIYKWYERLKFLGD
ncbi:MAG: TIGR03546 family protein [Calditrichaeota bacterium]|nr:TIGR03546 family protein [Calditrichota bacterium]RQV92871.1 MAG: TIGR03546 family protein [bacterium]RQW02622.1 MAG: TIGR03546 family protein [Calditrichota bacterium]